MSGRTRWSDLYSGRGSGLHQSGIFDPVCARTAGGAKNKTDKSDIAIVFI
jgi:hypothetical protein